MPFSFTAEQRPRAPWLLFGLLLSAMMIFLGLVPTSLVASAILACALHPPVDRHALLVLPAIVIVSVAVMPIRFNYLKSSFHNQP